MTGVAEGAPWGNEFTSKINYSITGTARRAFQSPITSPISSTMLGSKSFPDFKEKNLPQQHQLLPAILTNDLFVLNGRLTQNEENELITEIRLMLATVPDPAKRLELVRNELTDYDPYENGWVDASTAQRTCLKHFRNISTGTQTWQRLFLLFARNPQRPREVYYNKLLVYFSRILNSKDFSETPTTPARSSVSVDRGDSKLISEIEKCLREAEISSVDFERLRHGFSMADRGRTGTIGEEQMDKILYTFHLKVHLKSVLNQILDRCDKQKDKQYDWEMFLRLLEKGHPVKKTQETKTVGHGHVQNGIQKEQQKPELETNFTEHHNGYTHGTNEVTKESTSSAIGHKTETDKEQTLASIDLQIQQLTRKADKLRQELALEQQMGGNEQLGANGERLMNALRKLDPDQGGWINLNKAHQVILQYNNLHGLGLKTRFIQNILSLSANQAETHVQLDVIGKYLKNLEQN